MYDKKFTADAASCAAARRPRSIVGLLYTVARHVRRRAGSAGGVFEGGLIVTLGHET